MPQVFGGSIGLKEYFNSIMTQSCSPVDPSSLEDDDGVFSEEPEIIRPSPEDAGRRLDVFLAVCLGITRSNAKKLVDGGNIRLQGAAKTKAGLKITPDMTLVITAPPGLPSGPEPEDVAFDVVYEDDRLLVIDKPGGLVVHPAPGNWRGTLVNGLLYRYPDIRNAGDPARPGIVHRLDGPTSGLMAVARDQAALDNLQAQFRQREVKKEYLALVRGGVKNRAGTINAPIGRSPANRLRMAVAPGGREAVTNFRRLWTRGGFSLMEFEIPTGRTHQIRVHSAAMGHPVLGDSLYGGGADRRLPEGRIFLHSWKLSFLHPCGAPLYFTSPLPAELTGRLREILSKDGG
ncbi:MAG: RluA family pseudouridine synthase [Aminivibrio sp.]|jgi:23S rRNA pseudouridine1911/1915/1917 synthase